MPTPTPYVFFKDGQCEAAMRFYAGIFGAPEPVLYPAGDMGQPGYTMHAEVHLGGGMLAGADDFDGTTPPMEGSSIMVSSPDIAETKGWFDALSEGGEVRMGWEENFFSPGFGSLTDRYGIRWMVTTEQDEAGDGSAG
ncbi:VOC family protein [Pseudoroseicyclus tamaricis]|uniref:VOC family protein n=1 Tax=Pseudoroseicyclus tamaricis TaxID=2705421 RepID=A0A6B2JW93_9RHOB|nr:VOC family protein [Pseudoroseicyclus tamaricis]NDV00484.1 VOC family protein [Pseudoroseicyclus tamaricis]